MSSGCEEARELLICTEKEELNGARVAVEIGAGLDLKSVDRLFEAFHLPRSEAPTSLTVCCSIIEAHGGRMWAGE